MHPSVGFMKSRSKSILQGFVLPLIFPLLLSSLTFPTTSGLSGLEYDYGLHPKLVCTPIPADADPSCFSSGGAHGNSHYGPNSRSPNRHSWRGMTDEAKSTILHLRETLVRQKETILNQRETIRELTAKLAHCEGFRRGMRGHDDHTAHHPQHPYSDHNHRMDHHYPPTGQHSDPHTRGKAPEGDKHSMASSPEHTRRILQALKERLENLQQSRNTTSSYSNSLRDLLQRRINTLENQLRHRPPSHGSRDYYSHYGHHSDHVDYGHNNDHYGHNHDNHQHHYPEESRHNDDGLHHSNDHHENGQHSSEKDSHSHLPEFPFQRHRQRAVSHGPQNNKLDAVLSHLHNKNLDTGSRRKPKSPGAFQIGFPMRTNYMYGRVKRTLHNEIFALTLCLWLKGGAGPGLGTPFSYSAPGQANELVLIEWGNNPMELLVNDKGVTLPFTLSGGKWHHVCVTWSAQDGLWEAYLDGVHSGSGEHLSSWHPIQPGGVFILGQEQDTLGGRFDATQAFVGEMSDVQLWSRVLPSHQIYNLASCRNHMSGNVIAWKESEVELHGGVPIYPFDPCH